MTVDVREQCLSAIETILGGLNEFAHFERVPDWDADPPDLRLGPGCAMFDGSEATEPEYEAPDIDMVRMSVSVEVLALTSSARETSIELNRLRAVVRHALGLDPNLGGLAVDHRYLGCDDPEPLDLNQGPSDGRMRLSFEVRRLEGAYDPYSSA